MNNMDSPDPLESPEDSPIISFAIDENSSQSELGDNLTSNRTTEEGVSDPQITRPVGNNVQYSPSLPEPHEREPPLPIPNDIESYSSLNSGSPDESYNLAADAAPTSDQLENASKILNMNQTMSQERGKSVLVELATGPQPEDDPYNLPVLEDIPESTSNSVENLESPKNEPSVIKDLITYHDNSHKITEPVEGDGGGSSSSASGSQNRLNQEKEKCHPLDRDRDLRRSSLSRRIASADDGTSSLPKKRVSWDVNLSKIKYLPRSEDLPFEEQSVPLRRGSAKSMAEKIAAQQKELEVRLSQDGPQQAMDEGLEGKDTSPRFTAEKSKKPANYATNDVEDDGRFDTPGLQTGYTYPGLNLTQRNSNPPKRMKPKKSMPQTSFHIPQKYSDGSNESLDAMDKVGNFRAADKIESWKKDTLQAPREIRQPGPRDINVPKPTRDISLPKPVNDMPRSSLASPKKILDHRNDLHASPSSGSPNKIADHYLYKMQTLRKASSADSAIKVHANNTPKPAVNLEQFDKMANKAVDPRIISRQSSAANIESLRKSKPTISRSSSYTATTTSHSRGSAVFQPVKLAPLDYAQIPMLTYQSRDHPSDFVMQPPPSMPYGGARPGFDPENQSYSDYTYNEFCDHVWNYDDSYDKLWINQINPLPRILDMTHPLSKPQLDRFFGWLGKAKGKYVDSGLDDASSVSSCSSCEELKHPMTYELAQEKHQIKLEQQRLSLLFDEYRYRKSRLAQGELVPNRFGFPNNPDILHARPRIDSSHGMRGMESREGMGSYYAAGGGGIGAAGTRADHHYDRYTSQTSLPPLPTGGSVPFSGRSRMDSASGAGMGNSLMWIQHQQGNATSLYHTRCARRLQIAPFTFTK